MNFDKVSTFAMLKDLAKKHNIKIATTQQPRPLGRSTELIEEPKAITMDYLPLRKVSDAR
jgi:hypothetical protein